MSKPATPPLGSEAGPLSLPAGAWSTRQHTTHNTLTPPHTGTAASPSRLRWCTQCPRASSVTSMNPAVKCTAAGLSPHEVCPLPLPLIGPQVSRASEPLRGWSRGSRPLVDRQPPVVDQQLPAINGRVLYTKLQAAGPCVISSPMTTASRRDMRI